MRVSWLTATLTATLVLGGCGGAPDPAGTPGAAPSEAASPSPTRASQPPPSPRPTPTAEPTPTPPPWLGTRPLPLAGTGFGEVRRTPPALRERAFTLPDTVDPLPGRDFASEVVSPVPAQVLRRSTWEPGCPVAAEELAWVRLSFHGFDDQRHTGELLLHADVADDVVSVFRELYRADVPVEELRITRAEELDAAPTGDGNNSGAFVCRPVVGGSTYSQHAYGLAVDLNPFQNPYTKGADVVLPELASSYLDRDRRRPGMYDADSVVVAAFDRIGWTWGGTWRTAQDRHHFSLTGG